MALALVRCSIEVDHGGTLHVCQGKGKFGKLGGEKSWIVFMVPLGLPSGGPMAQALQLPFEYLIIL